MPELPDVESYRRFFARHAAGRTVRRVVVPDPTILRNATPQALDRALRGRTFEEPERIGKWLICWTDGPALLLHFGMTGFLVWSEDEPARHRHDRVILELEGGDELRYRNMRKLGGAWLAHDRPEAALVVGALGPDALAIGRKEFLDRLARRRGGVKAALMDQTFVAGVGNLVADEVLWQAGLHPKRTVESLDDAERAELYRRMHAVLKESVEKYDYIPRKRSWLSHVRGVPGSTCPRCGTPLERITAAGRTTYFCPRDQPDPIRGSARSRRAPPPNPPPALRGGATRRTRAVPPSPRRAR
jgi:formamidopyrimidine-DNA glycosylase